MVVIWVAGVHVYCDNKNRLLMCWVIVVKVHLCRPCLNEVSASVDAFFLRVCVCLHLSRLSEEILPLPLKR